MPNIYIYDEFNPQDTAMLQALYSRSPKSVVEHVEKVRQTGSGKFMEQFYVGYGHNSIADCGSTTVFIEGVSMLADKAIQDWPMYSGQETSTRYIDMSKQPIINPLKNEEGKEILRKWMNFYTSNQETVAKHIKAKYPKKPDENEDVYEKAVKSRTFDILRGFLPAGITTQLSWHTNLRQAWDKLALLRHHPLEETRTVAEKILEGLKEKYSHSFSHKTYEEQEDYRQKCCEKYSFHEILGPVPPFYYTTSIRRSDYEKYKDIINARPKKTNLPQFLLDLGLATFNFALDFGSFRDIQRHRNGVCRMPLLTVKNGFNAWYLEQLPQELRQEAAALINEQSKTIELMPGSPEAKQYYIAMGFNVHCSVSYGLPAAIYVVELRSGKLVHPSLRKIAHQMHFALQELFPGITLHSDLDQDDWDIRRGKQDIVAKA